MITRNSTGRYARRGIAAFAIVIVLALLSLAVVGMVLAGARDQDLTVSRLETLRAMYASESGAAMAIREVQTGVDQDSDGAIGSISDDGNAANNPVIGGASVWVDRTVVSGGATLDVKGSTSVARRNLQIAVQESSQTMIIYGENPSSIPVTRTWSGSAWSSESTTLAIGGKPRWIIAAACPTRNETAVICCDDQQDVNVMVHNGSTWGNLIEVSATLGTRNDRPLSLAYEQLSGDALAVFRIGNPSTIYYRTWNGTAWSSQQSTANLSLGRLKFLKLIPKPNSNQIVLLALDDDRDLVGMVWDGSAWGNKMLLSYSAVTSNEECMDGAFEAASGDGLVMWGYSGQNTPHYRTWTSGGWGSEGIGPNVGGPSRWIRLATDPASDRLMLMSLDDSQDANVALWTGSAWGSAIELETEVTTDTRRAATVTFEPGGTNAVAMYAEGSLTTPRYRTFNGSAWSSELTAPSVTDDQAAFQLAPIGSSGELLAIILTRGQDKLYSMYWNGTSFGSTVQLEADVAARDTHEAFIVTKGGGGGTTVQGVAAVQP